MGIIIKMNSDNEKEVLDQQIDIISKVKTREDFEQISLALHHFFQKIVLKSLNPLVLISLCNNYLAKLFHLF